MSAWTRVSSGHNHFVCPLFRPYLLIYACMLGYYILLVYQSAPVCDYDECAYFELARLILESKTSVEEGFHVHWGPGWPAVLASIKYFFDDLLLIRLFNVFFVVTTLVYLRKALGLFVSLRPATLITIVYSFYPLNFINAREAWSESFFNMMLILFVFYYLSQLRVKNMVHLIIASVVLAIAIMVKTYYGYVSMVMLMAVPITIFMFYRDQGVSVLRATTPFALALVMCVPFLKYTYDITGKLFYWSSNGGSMIYWTSYPQENNYGDWHFFRDVHTYDKLTEQKDFLEKIGTTENRFLRDTLYKEKAIENIVNFPSVYLKNVLSNVSRLLFNFPFSFSEQKTRPLIYTVPNAFLLSMFLFSLLATYLYRLELRPEEWVLFLIVSVSFFGHILIFALVRYFHPLSMIITLLVASTLAKLQRREATRGLTT